MRSIRLPAATLAAFLAIACQATAAPATGQAATRADLEGRDLVSSVVEFQGETVELVPGAQFDSAALVLRFGPSRIGATGGCNWYGAESWDIRGGVLLVSPEFSGTLIGCSTASQRQDEWLIDLLRSEPMITIDGERYLFQSADTRVVFVEGKVELL